MCFIGTDAAPVEVDEKLTSVQTHVVTETLKLEPLQVEETDDSCILDYIEIVPVDRDTDGSCTTECVNGDWSAEVKEENLAVVKQEPDDVYCVISSATYIDVK